ncbi:MAG: hypothetical protein HKN23_10230 [Verrucomicrobiales bacterium]|nr:hypothetical protein [Verrucomicrobiales bacterium]
MNPTKNHSTRTLTLTESGLLHQAMIRRRKQDVQKRYVRMKASSIRRAVTRDVDKTIQKFTGRAIARFVYGMWRKGYFDRYDEFSSTSESPANRGAA